MANFSTYEALKTLCTSVPEWNGRLDELNGQIALRQIELARLTESERPPTRSLKNKGSTESLRPNDVDQNPFLSHDSENPDNIQLNPFDTPDLKHNGPRPGSPTAIRTAAVTTPPPLKASSNPRPAGNITRKLSQPTPPGQTKAIRKRKTESLASGESNAPKYRTRSMIIVYYDSAVQQAFEDLVKFVSGSRNAMRKGKMHAKMEEMKRASELTLGADDEDDDEPGLDLGTNSRGLQNAQKSVAVNKQGASAGDSDEEELGLPRLRFVSTRRMGPSRGDTKAENNGAGKTLSVGLLKGYRRAGVTDIFEAVDKGLEWVQGQCEHAAHQFLRDGECSTEIANIKRRLAEVKETAEKEMERLKEEGIDRPAPTPTPSTQPVGESRSMQMRTTLMRRELSSLKDLEVDDGMEVDDEGVDDLEPAKLVFKRSRDVAL